MNRSLLGIVVVAIIAIVAFSTSAFIVKETERVVITQFGEVVRLEEAPGLSFKIPFVQEVKRLDKRWLEWDGDANQITTLDKRYIYIDAFARWRISDPMLFMETLRDERSAQGRLDDIIDNATRNVIANHRLIEVIRSTNRQFEYDAEEASMSMRVDEMMNESEAMDAESGETAPEGSQTDDAAEEEADTAATPENEDAETEAEADTAVEAPDAETAEGNAAEAEAAEGDNPADETEPAPAAKPVASPEEIAEQAQIAAGQTRRAKAAEQRRARRRNPYATKYGRNTLTRLVLEKASSKASQLGIEIKDVQIKRINYIESVQAKVFDRMISERKRVAESYRSEGQGRSAEILGKMEMELQQIQSEAYKTSQKIMGRADAKAAETYAKAYKKDPDFYQFTKTMESYKKTISDDSWLLLSTDADFARYLKSIK